MKIALASAPVKNGKTDFNLQTMIEYVKEYGGRADLILFGESVLQGFDCLCWEYEKDRYIAAGLTDEPIRAICAAAKVNQIAVSFGLIERGDDGLYSSQIFIGADGNIVNVFRRVSIGWKEYKKTDVHYREGEHFEKFRYGGKSFAVGLCGDLWTDGRPEEMNALNADVVLWPVWCDYDPDEWNDQIKYEYASQAALCGREVLLVNPFCADPERKGSAAGGSIHFRAGMIREEQPSGKIGVLIADAE